MSSAIMSKIAPYMSKAKAIAEPLYGKITNEGMPLVAKNYAEIMAKNQQYVVKDAAQASVLHKQLVFTNLAKIPVNIQAAKAESMLWKKTCENWKECTVKEGLGATWFALEVYAFFVVGEIAGRGFTLVDYQVPGML